MNFVQRLGAVAGLCLLAVGTASASTYQITGTLYEADNQPGADQDNLLSGTYVFTYDTNGLPITDQNNITATVSNVSGSVSLSDGTSVFGTDGTGEFFYDDEHDNTLDLSAGALGAEFYLPLDFDGIGSVNIGDDQNSSLVQVNGLYYYNNGGTGTEVTPEPGSISLMLLGLSASGCAWGTARRRLAR